MMGTEGRVVPILADSARKPVSLSRPRANPECQWVRAMSNNAITGKTVLLFGLDHSLGLDLDRVLSAGATEYRSESFQSLDACAQALERTDVAAVFCSADRGQYAPLLGLIGGRQRQVRVIVVSRGAETSEWLDAIEAGANDYCSPPFEPVLIDWLLSATRNRQQIAAA